MTIRVYILSRPQFTEEHQAFLEDFLPEGDKAWQEGLTTTAAERLIEFAGRCCYMSFGSRQSPKSNAEYIRTLIANGHDSVLEHAGWTILLSGVSRAFTHQLVRHRIGFSYSQLSQQYHDESDVHFVRPAELAEFSDLEQLWDQATNEARTAYRRILNGLAEQSSLFNDKREALRAMRSAARSVLPNATETVIVVSFNARALRHFLLMRGSILGDVEMRRASAAILQAIRPEGPALFFDFTIENAADGLPLVVRHPQLQG